MKHGKAQNITIDLETGNELRLTVQDDGVGFHHQPDGNHVRRDAAGTPISGMGLLVMRYRAGVIGGRLEIDTAPGRGTTVRCRVPGRIIATSASSASPGYLEHGTSAMPVVPAPAGSINPAATRR